MDPDNNKASAAAARSVYVLRDADALGLDFGDYSDGYVEHMTMPGVGGILPNDRIVQSAKHRSADSLLGELLVADTRALWLKVVPAATSPLDIPLTTTTTSSHTTSWKRAISLCERQKYLEAAGLFSLGSNTDALACGNHSACLQLGGELDQAILVARRMIETWPEWELGYCRLFSCLVERQDWHGAVRCMAQGLQRLPDALCLLRRLAGLAVLKREGGLVCLLDAEEGFALSLSWSTQELNIPFPLASKFRPQSAFHLLIPAHASRAVLVNGLPVARVEDAAAAEHVGGGYDPLVYLVRWQLDVGGEEEEKSSSAISLSSSLASSSASIAGIPSTTTTTTTSYTRVEAPTLRDVVRVAGSGLEDCNAHAFYPQGLRNERPWYENVAGYTLSFEQSASGLCAWVVGRNKQDVCYVLRPGEDPQGPPPAPAPTVAAAADGGGGSEASSGWIALHPSSAPTPAYVGKCGGGGGDGAVMSSKALVQWLEAHGDDDDENEETADKLVALKGQAIQLFEGGWYEEAKALLETVLRYYASSSSCSSSSSPGFSQECEYWLAEAQTETELFLQAAADMRREDGEEEEEEEGSNPQQLTAAVAAHARNDLQRLHRRVTQSQMERVVFNLTELGTGKKFEFMIERNLLMMMAKVDQRQLWFCCCAAPPPVRAADRAFHPEDVDLSFEDEEDVEEEEAAVVAVAAASPSSSAARAAAAEAASRLKITQLADGVKRYFNTPSPPIVQLLKAWKQFGSSA